MLLLPLKPDEGGIETYSFFEGLLSLNLTDTDQQPHCFLKDFAG